MYVDTHFMEIYLNAKRNSNEDHILSYDESNPLDSGRIHDLKIRKQVLEEIMDDLSLEQRDRTDIASHKNLTYNEKTSNHPPLLV